MAPVRNKRVILKRHVMAGLPSEDDMEVVTAEAPPPAYVPARLAAVVVKNLYISCDPYLRSRMISHEVPSYIPDFVPGDVLVSHGVMKVISSGHQDFKTGDLVWGMTGWEEYTVINNPDKINHPEFPLSYYTGVLGMPGQTAYAGFFQCPSLRKVNLLKTKFGFDDAFNYKEPDLDAALKRCFPKGIDIYFENVGGAMHDAVLPNMQLGGRIAVCRMISQYNLERPEGVHNLLYIVTKRLQMEGFAVFDYITADCQFEEEMAGYLREGKVAYVEDIVEGLDAAPAALVGLFTGRNVGKHLVAIARE